MEDRIRIGISTCLLGEKVRFDSGHKKDRYLTDILGGYFERVGVFSEVEVGMGIPREAVRLTENPENSRMVGVKSGTDSDGEDAGVFGGAGPRDAGSGPERIHSEK